MVVVIFIISIIAFIIIQLPPGTFFDRLFSRMKEAGIPINDEFIAQIERQYGFGMPMYQQYFKWIGGIIFHGDFGESFEFRRPVLSLLRERIPMTMLISLTTLLMTYLIAIPIGIYSATHQYSIFDYAWTVFGFLGLATPNFLLALLLMYIFYTQFGMDIGGLLSLEYQLMDGWNLAKVWDLIKHLPIPLIVLGTAGTAGMIRVLRGTLLDELGKAYVVTARAKGVSETRLLFKYPVRIAINPMVSNIGQILPQLISGASIVAIVMNLPTTGPLLLNAVRSQDMYMAASFLLILSTLSVIGVLVSDILLAVVDPRIRYSRISK